MRFVAWRTGVVCAGALLHACARPPVNTALVVRNLESKCALIAFSGCAAFTRADRAEDDDAGSSTAD